MSFIIRKALLTDVAAIVQLERAHVDDELLGSNSQLHAHSFPRNHCTDILFKNLSLPIYKGKLYRRLTLVNMDPFGYKNQNVARECFLHWLQN